MNDGHTVRGTIRVFYVSTHVFAGTGFPRVLHNTPTDRPEVLRMFS